MEIFSLLLRACGIGVLASLCIVVVGQFSGGYAAALRVGGALLIFGILMIVLDNGISALGEALFADKHDNFAAEAFEVMLKALGVALTSRFCSDICRDCGEQTLANAVESVGGISIFVLAVPMMVKLLECVSDMLEMIE